MSGGSYMYLCHATGEDLLDSSTEKAENLTAMAKRLSELEYAKKVSLRANELATNVKEARLIIVKLQDLVDEEMKELSEVFKAVEWWDSGDWSESDVKKAIEDFDNRE